MGDHQPSAAKPDEIARCAHTESDLSAPGAPMGSAGADTSTSAHREALVHVEVVELRRPVSELAHLLGKLLGLRPLRVSHRLVTRVELDDRQVCAGSITVRGHGDA